jgi:hypothetical protein
VKPRYLRPTADIPRVFLYRDAVDFRKQSNGGIKGSVQQPIIYEALGCYEGLVKTWFRP